MIKLIVLDRYLNIIHAIDDNIDTELFLNYCSIYSYKFNKKRSFLNLTGFIEFYNRSHKHKISSTFLHIIIKSDHWPIIRIVLLYCSSIQHSRKVEFFHLIAKEFDCITKVSTKEIPYIATLCNIRIIFFMTIYVRNSIIKE